jgi:hypothetical protein
MGRFLLWFEEFVEIRPSLVIFASTAAGSSRTEIRYNLVFVYIVPAKFLAGIFLFAFFIIWGMLATNAWARF